MREIPSVERAVEIGSVGVVLGCKGRDRVGGDSGILRSRSDGRSGVKGGQRRRVAVGVSTAFGAPASAFGVFALVFAFSSAFTNEEGVSAAGSIFSRHVPVLIEQEFDEG